MIYASTTARPTFSFTDSAHQELLRANINFMVLIRQSQPLFGDGVTSSAPGQQGIQAPGWCYMNPPDRAPSNLWVWDAAIATGLGR